MREPMERHFRIDPWGATAKLALILIGSWWVINLVLFKEI